MSSLRSFFKNLSEASETRNLVKVSAIDYGSNANVAFSIESPNEDLVDKIKYSGGDTNFE